MTSESTTNHTQDSAYHNEDQNQMKNSGTQPDMSQEQGKKRR